MQKILGILSTIMGLVLLFHWIGLSMVPIIEPVEILAAGILLIGNGILALGDYLKKMQGP
jgi:hypothetical protein